VIFPEMPVRDQGFILGKYPFEEGGWLRRLFNFLHSSY
jgi:hypothetical protein